MVWFHGIDTSARQVTVTFDYESENDEEALKFAKEKLGEHMTLEELGTFIQELKEYIE